MIFQILDRIFNYLFLAIITLLGIALIMDIVFIINNPYEYKNVHNFSETVLTWKSKSVLLYVLKDVLFLAVLTILFGVGYIGKVNSTLKYIYYCVLVVFFGSLFWGYYQWYLTGFDH